MSSIHDDSTPETDASTTSSDPFSIGSMDTASETSKLAADASPDCQLQPTAGLDDSAGELQDGMDQLAETALNVAQEAVDGLEAAAEYVRTTDGRQMLATLQTFIKNNPGVSLTVAAAFGFVVGRSIRRD
jgi:X-X-X-Leu-X-X-Gly heptad repeat protein